VLGGSSTSIRQERRHLQEKLAVLTARHREGTLFTWHREVQTKALATLLQMAARETGFGAVEQYLHAGKLLALELLVRILENPHHHWSALRPEV
jgi:hypothetical protein